MKKRSKAKKNQISLKTHLKCKKKGLSKFIYTINHYFPTSVNIVDYNSNPHCRVFF